MLNKISVIAIYLLVTGGLYGALFLSYNTITGIAPCPGISGIPVCFVVALGYTGMVLGLLLSKTTLTVRLFLPGWFVVFSIAAIGTLLEITVGNSCPSNELGMPLCYISFALSILILILFKLRPSSKANAFGRQKAS